MGALSHQYGRRLSFQTLHIELNTCSLVMSINKYRFHAMIGLGERKGLCFMLHESNVREKPDMHLTPVLAFCIAHVFNFQSHVLERCIIFVSHVLYIDTDVIIYGCFYIIACLCCPSFSSVFVRFVNLGRFPFTSPHRQHHKVDNAYLCYQNRQPALSINGYTDNVGDTCFAG